MGREMSKRLQQLLVRRDQIQARISDIQSRDRSRQRRLDTRRKILLGALLQHWMEDDDKLSQRVDQALEAFLTRAIDRQAFGLESPSPPKVRRPNSAA